MSNIVVVVKSLSTSCWFTIPRQGLHKPLDPAVFRPVRTFLSLDRTEEDYDVMMCV